MDTINDYRIQKEDKKNAIIVRGQAVSNNVITFDAESNCPQGGDSGHGGYTKIKLKDENGTCWKIKVDDIEIDDLTELEITLFGDSEYDTINDILEAIVSGFKIGKILLKE